MRIVMRNVQVDYQIVQIDEKSLLFESLSLLEKRKMRGSLQFTENFETDELATYLNMVECIDKCNDISETEKYSGIMLQPCYKNVTLLDDIF